MDQPINLSKSVYGGCHHSYNHGTVNTNISRAATPSNKPVPLGNLRSNFKCVVYRSATKIHGTPYWLQLVSSLRIADETSVKSRWRQAVDEICRYNTARRKRNRGNVRISGLLIKTKYQTPTRCNNTEQQSPLSVWYLFLVQPPF